MNRPLSEFFTSGDIDRMYMLSTTVSSLCYGCEEPIGQSHYRLTSTGQSTTVLVCAKCAMSLKREVLKNRQAKPAGRPHFSQLTEAETKQQDRFNQVSSKPARRKGDR